MNFKKYSKIYLLSTLFLACFMVACEPETIIEEPEAYYDEGEHLVLNNNLVIYDESSLTHNGAAGFEYDSATQILKFDTVCAEMKLDTGLILNIDTEEGVLNLLIEDVQVNNAEYVLQTSMSSVNKVFDNISVDFDFNPTYTNQKLLANEIEGLTKEELSAALTDDNNAIHPSEVQMIIAGKKLTLFSVRKNISMARNQSTSATNSNRVGFEHQINLNKTLVSVGPIDLKLEDLGFSWYSDLQANIKTKTKKSWGVTYYHSAEAKFYARNMDIEAWIDVAAVVSGKAPLVSENDPLLLPVEMRFEFPVGGVPVMIGVEFALDLAVEIDVSGEVKVGTGYTLGYHIPEVMVGAHMTQDGFDLSTGPLHSYTAGYISKKEMHPLKLEAMAAIDQTYTLKPTLGFSIYNMAGPEVALSVGAEVDFEVGGGVSVDLTNETTPEAYIGWGSALKTKIGATGGAWIDVFGIVNKHWDIPQLPLVPSFTIWKTPHGLADESNDALANTVVGESKDVTVKVKDSFGLPAPFMFVEWESNGGGHWAEPITIATTGSSTNTWIPTDEGTFSPYCYVKNGTLKEMGRVTFTTTTTASSN